MAFTRRTWQEWLGLTERMGVVCAMAAGFLVLADIILTVGFILPRMGSHDFFRLHYTSALGVDWLGGWPWLLLYPAGALALLVVNALIAGGVGRGHRLYGVVAWFATATMEAAIALSTIAVLIINARG